MRMKISVSVPAELVRQIDRAVAGRRYASRSAAVEVALQSLARDARNAEIEAYYSDRSPEEREDERAWGRLGHEAFVANALADARPTVAARQARPARRSRSPRR